MSTQAHGAIPEFTLADRLRKARETTGLTAQEFADEIGVSRGTISNAEGGARHPRTITIRAYALRTGVPLAWLETGETPARPEPDGGEVGTGHVRTGGWANPLVRSMALAA